MVRLLFHLALLLMPLGLLAYIFYYTFAVLGIYFFEYQIESTADSILNNSICNGTAYETLKYHPYDFASSLVTLWNLMVVNNWYIIVEAYVCRTQTTWSAIFFTLWWFLMETILNGILFGALLYIITESPLVKTVEIEYNDDWKSTLQKLWNSVIGKNDSLETVDTFNIFEAKVINRIFNDDRIWQISSDYIDYAIKNHPDLYEQGAEEMLHRINEAVRQEQLRSRRLTQSI